MKSVLVVAECVGIVAVEALVLEEVGPQRFLPPLLALASVIARVTGAECVALGVKRFELFLELSERFLDCFAEAKRDSARATTRTGLPSRRTIPRRGSLHSSSVQRLVARRE